MSTKKPAENPFAANIQANIQANNEKMARIFGGPVPQMSEFTAATEEAKPEPPPPAAEESAARRGQEAEEDAAPEYVSVNSQLLPEHRTALQQKAFELHKRRGGKGGRMDTSAVLRRILDRWMEGGCKL